MGSLSVCLSVMLVYCGQMVGRVKIKLGMRVGLSPGHIVLDGDPAPPPPKGHSPPIFVPCQLWPNGWMDQDATWYRGRPRPRRLCQMWTHLPLPKRGQSPPPIFGRCLLWQNAWMDQDGTLHGGGPRSRPHCARWGPISPSPKRGSVPNFRPLSIVPKRLDASICHLIWR